MGVFLLMMGMGLLLLLFMFLLKKVLYIAGLIYYELQRGSGCWKRFSFPCVFDSTSCVVLLQFNYSL